MVSLTCPFDRQASLTAYDAWGANCGPHSLAFALQRHIDHVRGVIPGFEEKRFTNPTMMQQALNALNVPNVLIRCPPGSGAVPAMFADQPAIVRVQWTGPWTQPGASPAWGYRMTHYIVSWKDEGDDLVFDCNCGVVPLAEWVRDTVPDLVRLFDRADGGWFPTHIWQVKW